MKSIDDFANEPEPVEVILIEFDLAKAMEKPWWFPDAACRPPSPDEPNTNTFFPEANTHGGGHLTKPRQMCLNCVVRYECLEYGLNEPFGVWGGHSPSQRRRIQGLVKSGSSLENASQQIDARSRDGRRQ